MDCFYSGMKKSLTALAFGTLGLGIAEFVMMGILPDVAKDLHISIPQAGHFISAYALGVCVGAPGMVLVARTRPLKHILLGLMVIYICGNLCAAASVNYWMMLMMRFISGLPHGAFFGVGSIVAERVADKGKSSQAVALMVSGMTIANLFGVPFIIRKTKCSGPFERSDISCKTKRPLKNHFPERLKRNKKSTEFFYISSAFLFHNPW